MMRIVSKLVYTVKGTPGYQNKGISQYRLGVDDRKDASKNIFCAIAGF